MNDIIKPNITQRNPNLIVADFNTAGFKFKYYRQTGITICMSDTGEQTLLDEANYDVVGLIYNPAFKEHKFLSGWIHKMCNYVLQDPWIAIGINMLIKYVVESNENCYKFNSMDIYETIIDQCDKLNSYVQMHPQTLVDVRAIFEMAMRTNSDVYRFYAATHKHMMDIFLKNDE